jgi:hypothetical protein
MGSGSNEAQPISRIWTRAKKARQSGNATESAILKDDEEEQVFVANKSYTLAKEDDAANPITFYNSNDDNDKCSKTEKEGAWT